MDSFNREAKLKNVKSLEELNRLWSVFLEEYYHKKPHKGIAEYYESLGASVPENGITPLQEWNRDTRPLNFIDTSIVSEAFLHHEERKVDKGACISFRGQRYETKPELIGYKVGISYDPAAPEVLTITYPGYEPFTARPLKIGAYCDKNPTLPVSMREQKPSTSRFLDALETQHEKNREQVANAISFTETEIQELKSLIQKGGKGYRIKHAQILLKLDQKPENSSWTYDRIKEAYGASHSTIAGIAQRFVTEGMESALGRKEQKNRHRKVTGDVEARICAIACSTPPEGASRWTMQAIAEELIRLEVVDYITDSTVCNVMKKTKLNRGL